MARRKKERSYRWYAFTHWLNLGFLALGGVATFMFGPAVWLVFGPVELGILWLVPDLPSFRAMIDRSAESDDILREREYYIRQLWNVSPRPPKTFGEKIAGLFTESSDDNMDDRVINRNSHTFLEYQEMRGIVRKLNELEEVSNVTAITEREIKRFEQVINGYLRYTIAAKSLQTALNDLNESSIERDIADIDKKLSTTDRQLHPVLQEQRQLKLARLKHIPRLRAKLALFKARADAIVHQMRNIHGQVLADPGMNMNSFLDELVERQEILADPLGMMDMDGLDGLDSIAVPRRASRNAQKN